MKNDPTTTLLNFVLAILVVLCVAFGMLYLMRTHQLRQLEAEAQVAQSNSMRVQALLRDVVAYNNTAKSPELNQILQSAMNPQQPPAK